MPPKRKALLKAIEETSLKRHTRSTGLIIDESQSLGRAIASSPTKHKTPTKTYGRSQRNNLPTYNSGMENESRESLARATDMRGVTDEESSEDELDLTRFSESPQKVIKAPMPPSNTVLPARKHSAKGPIPDTEAPRTHGRVKIIDTHPPKATSKPHCHTEETCEASDHPPLALSRTPQKSHKTVTYATSPTLPATSRPKSVSQTETPDGLIRSINTMSALVSSRHTPRVAHVSPITSPAHMSASYGPTRQRHTEQEVGSDSLTPTKRRRGRPSKRELPQGRESSSLWPSPKKRKLMFETSSPPNAVSQPASHTPSITSSNPDLTLEPTSNLPSVSTPSWKYPPKQSPVIRPTCTHIPEILPMHLYPCLNVQKRILLRALQQPFNLRLAREEGEVNNGTEPETNEVAFQQLRDLLSGTVDRGEGNSCLILGPRGSGKSGLVERCIASIPDKPIVLRLSGWTQHSDRLAMREIAYQLNHQTGTTILVHLDDVPGNMDSDHPADEPNPFLDKPTPSTPIPSVSLPPASHLPALISILPSLPRPTIVILDGFDLFSLHPRQSLLYCLLDTAQSCRASTGNRGLAIIGVTTRVDTINLLEKRVKSRFSGRILRTAPPQKLEYWVKYARTTLLSNAIDTNQKEGYNEEWNSLWNMAVEGFLHDRAVINALNETFSITRDIRMLNKILVSVALHLTPSSPFPSASRIMSTILSQRSRPRLPFLHTLSYPALCLLIASIHADTAGHSTFTFEMLHECFYDQVRASTSAPVQVNGGSIGMVRCSREVLMSAFEHLISIKTFICIASSASVAKEFAKYRSTVTRQDVKTAVDKTGQINLRKWLSKAQ